MNNKRRKQLKEWVKKAELLRSELETIQSDEEFAYDSMPEGPKNSLNGMNSEEAIDKMNEAIDCVNEAIDCIEDIA